MRTTVDIPDAQYYRLKQKAAQEGVSVKSLVLTGVKSVLGGVEEKPRRRLVEPILKNGTPGNLVLDNERIYDLIGFP